MGTAVDLEYVLADPAGNITALVTGKVPPGRYAGASAAVMAAEPGVEQVGFVVPPRHGAAGRLEMAGGEFCGNAARSFGYYLAKERGLGDAALEVEISGSAAPVAVRVAGEASEAEMPLPLAVEALEVPGLGALPAVVFEGIVHLIAEGQPAQEALARRIIQQAARAYAADAVGVMFLLEGLMTPVVHVVKTGTTVFEGSCGSGTAALGVHFALPLRQGGQSWQVRQPRGTIAVRVEKEDGRVTKLAIGGAVSLGPRRRLALQPAEDRAGQPL